jgi:hypothetical protein
MNPYEIAKEHAENLGMTLHQFCLKAGVNYETVRKWRDNPPKTIEIINQLNNAYDDLA